MSFRHNVAPPRAVVDRQILPSCDREELECGHLFFAYRRDRAARRRCERCMDAPTAPLDIRETETTLGGEVRDA